uniref:Uncharacterized protein n=1 Tax=uncultured Desulfobacterium sp. TaxID=201089 RepID=E1YFS4_9BACT|nr:unknown protein [uncultured Desulfobacterium sp.]
MVSIIELLNKLIFAKRQEILRAKWRLITAQFQSIQGIQAFYSSWHDFGNISDMRGMISKTNRKTRGIPA